MELSELQSMPKVDAHAHILTPNPAEMGELTRYLERSRTRWLDICLFNASDEGLEQQIAVARRAQAEHPKLFSWTTAFSLAGFGRQGWTERAIASVAAGAAAGAVGVKVWKNIGMELRDQDGRFVMIDDPRFDPALEATRRCDLTLTTHIGEPRNCWLPLEEMTVQGDRAYFSEHPRYHGLLHPQIPGYEAQVHSCERMLERHPGLRVVWCHLGSREYDVREIGRCLDRFPDLAMDLAERICHLQVQPQDAVRDFMLRFQDRILYGTDTSWQAEGGQGAASVEGIDRVYRADYRYFATDEPVETPNVRTGFSCRGLALPDGVLHKIFHDNAFRWYPGLGREPAKEAS